VKVIQPETASLLKTVKDKTSRFAHAIAVPVDGMIIILSAVVSLLSFGVRSRSSLIGDHDIAA